jgi:hypothetical protein
MDTRTDSTVPRPVSVGPEMEALGGIPTRVRHLTISTGRSLR